MEDSLEMPIGIGQQGKEGERYRKVKVLGQGSMGRAYLVESAEDSKLYVMKRINIGHLNEKQKDSALRQAQMHSLFTHPNIVGFKQVYQTTGQKICIVMEYAEGGDLQEFVQQQEGKYLDEHTILTLFVQICLGLQEVHAKRIVHRDLKTANIFLTSNKILKIGDFGISKSLDKTSMAATAMIGTPYYLSPQMVEGKPYSTKADIWALGVILYQLCALKLPFQANSLPVLALKILKGSFPSIPKQYSKDLKGLILQLLSVDQKKRPSIQAILLKPYLFRLLSKQDQVKQIEKQEKKKQAIIQNEKKTQDRKTDAVDKQKQMKVKARKEKEDKREEMRRQMREDLKKKRAQTKDYQTEKQYGTSLAPAENKIELKKSPAKFTKSDNITTPKLIPSAKQIPAKIVQKKLDKQQPIKPWKNRKPAEKKDITIEMYVPDLKPKTQIKKQEPLPSNSDFKVEIYVSKKPETNYISAPPDLLRQQQQRKTLPTIQPVSNYHYSDKHIEQEIDALQRQLQNEDDPSVEDSNSEYDIEELIDNVRTVEELTRNLPDPSKSICLYEESDNFDSTVPVNSTPKPEDIENLQHLINAESLEELRMILAQKLGQQKFFTSYSIVKDHIDEYYTLLMSQKQVNREYLKQNYVFNKDRLRQKLTILTQEQFERHIELLFTLIMYEDLEMQKNIEKNVKTKESKYSMLF